MGRRSVSNESRVIIIYYHKQGLNPTQISKKLNLSRKCVYNTIKRENEYGTVHHRAGGSRGRKSSPASIPTASVEPCLDQSESDVVIGSPPADIEGEPEENSLQTPQQEAHSNPKFHIRNFIKSNYKIKGMYLVTAFLPSMSPL